MDRKKNMLRNMKDAWTEQETSDMRLDGKVRQEKRVIENVIGK